MVENIAFSIVKQDNFKYLLNTNVRMRREFIVVKQPEKTFCHGEPMDVITKIQHCIMEISHTRRVGANGEYDGAII